MSDLPKRLRIKASMIALGERIAWGSDTALMEEAAGVIEALSAVRCQCCATMAPEGRERPRYVCRKCKQETRPPEPYKAYVLCDCGYMTAATTALAAAPAQPAAQAQGEVQMLREAPVVVATAILGGLFHGGSGPELGEIDIEVCTPALEELQCETVNSSDDVFLPLMTVAQHNRIVAALSAQQSAPELVSVPVELAARLQRFCQRPHSSRDEADALDMELRALLASHGRGDV